MEISTDVQIEIIISCKVAKNKNCAIFCNGWIKIFWKIENLVKHMLRIMAKIIHILSEKSIIKQLLEVVLMIYVNRHAENYKYINIIFLISISLILIIFNYI